jgi:hypothetical protein
VTLHIFESSVDSLVMPPGRKNIKMRSNAGVTFFKFPIVGPRLLSSLWATMLHHLATTRKGVCFNAGGVRAGNGLVEIEYDLAVSCSIRLKFEYEGLLTGNRTARLSSAR